MAEFMRNSDAFTWQMESDPRLRSTIVTVVLMDGTPDWDVVRERFDAVSRTLPMFRQRVVSTPGGTPPRWEPVVDFDLDYHVRRVGAPEPATFDGVLEMARLAQMEAFDPARPMWQATLVDGLENGGSALLCKVHHALTDGVGGVQLAMTLFELAPEGYRPELPDVPSLRQPTRWDDLRDGVRYNSKLARRLATGAVRTAPRALGALDQHHVRDVERFLRHHAAGLFLALHSHVVELGEQHGVLSDGRLEAVTGELERDGGVRRDHGGGKR